MTRLNIKKNPPQLLCKENFNFFYQIKLNPRFFLFPLLLLVGYEIFAIRVYQLLSAYPLGYYNYLIIVSAIVSFIASILSDKYSRRVFLNISLIICIGLVTLLLFKYEKLVVILAPLFFSTPIARAALIDNHEHISIKNLICVSYISVFLPWSFYSFFSLSRSDILIFAILILTIVSAIIFKIKKIPSRKLNITKSLLLKKNKWLYFAIAFILIQIVFFLIFGKLEYVENHANIFDFMNIGLLTGAFLCIFLTGKHDELIFLSYIFLFILAFNTFMVFLFWNQENLLNFFFGEIAIAGGVLLPLITEKAVLILGSSKRGLACGLVELVASGGSVIALIGINLFVNGYKGLIITILVLIGLSCFFQKINNYFSKKRIALDHKKENE